MQPDKSRHKPQPRVKPKCCKACARRPSVFHNLILRLEAAHAGQLLTSACFGVVNRMQVNAMETDAQLASTPSFCTFVKAVKAHLPCTTSPLHNQWGSSVHDQAVEFENTMVSLLVLTSTLCHTGQRLRSRMQYNCQHKTYPSGCTVKKQLRRQQPDHPCCHVDYTNDNTSTSVRCVMYRSMQ
jgi:hypothetical protein